MIILANLPLLKCSLGSLTDLLKVTELLQGQTTAKTGKCSLFKPWSVQLLLQFWSRTKINIAFAFKPWDFPFPFSLASWHLSLLSYFTAPTPILIVVPLPSEKRVLPPALTQSCLHCVILILTPFAFSGIYSVTLICVVYCLSFPFCWFNDGIQAHCTFFFLYFIHTTSFQYLATGKRYW